LTVLIGYWAHSPNPVIKEVNMDANLPTPTDRPSFTAALADVLADHATMRRLASNATRHPEAISIDAMMSIADIMATHELFEARLFATPFLTRTPESVLTTTTQVRMRCRDFLTGSHHLPDTNAAAALFVEALLAHITAEEAWLAREQQYRTKHLWADA
jgi:hypothetical protein